MTRVYRDSLVKSVGVVPRRQRQLHRNHPLKLVHLGVVELDGKRHLHTPVMNQRNTERIRSARRRMSGAGRERLSHDYLGVNGNVTNEPILPGLDYRVSEYL